MLNSSSESSAISWDTAESSGVLLLGGLGSGNSLLCGTGAIEDGMEGYAMSCRFVVFLNREMSTIQESQSFIWFWGSLQIPGIANGIKWRSPLSHPSKFDRHVPQITWSCLYLGHQFSCQNKFHKHKKTLLLLLFYISSVLNWCIDHRHSKNNQQKAYIYVMMTFFNLSAIRLQLFIEQSAKNWLISFNICNY